MKLVAVQVDIIGCIVVGKQGILVVRSTSRSSGNSEFIFRPAERHSRSCSIQRHPLGRKVFDYSPVDVERCVVLQGENYCAAD